MMASDTVGKVATLIDTSVHRGESVRVEMIRRLAYQLAACRGFTAGQELDDWLTAERRVDRHLALRAHLCRYGR